MTTTAREILTAFDTLAPADRSEVAVEILRRSAGSDGIPDETFDHLAGEIFRNYDTEEAAGAER